MEIANLSRTGILMPHQCNLITLIVGPTPNAIALMTFINSLSFPFLRPFSDPRVNDWPMMSSPLPSLGLCLFYAYFSKVLGPRLMANRQPFSLRKILIVYNLFQTIFSAWIFYEVRVK